MRELLEKELPSYRPAAIVGNFLGTAFRLTTLLPWTRATGAFISEPITAWFEYWRTIYCHEESACSLSLSVAAALCGGFFCRYGCHRSPGQERARSFHFVHRIDGRSYRHRQRSRTRFFEGGFCEP